MVAERPRPALRDRPDQAAHRAGLGAAVRRLRRGSRGDRRVVPHPRGLVATGQGRHRGGVRREGAVKGAPPVETTPIPGLLVLRLDVPRGRARLVQGELERRDMVAAGAARLRGGAAATSPTPVAPPAASTRAGTSWSRCDRACLRRGPAAGDSFGSVFTLELWCRAARGRQRLPDARGRHGVLLPGQRPLAAGRGVRRGRAGRSTSPRSPTRTAPSPGSRHRSVPPAADAGHRRGGQLAAEFPDAQVVTRAELDIADPAAVAAWPWREYDVVVNGRRRADRGGRRDPRGRVRPGPPTPTVRRCSRRRPPSTADAGALLQRLRLHRTAAAPEDEAPSPWGSTGRPKAAGDLAVAGTPRRYLVRTSWVVGDRGRTSSGRWPGWPTRAGPRPWSTTRWAG